MGSNIEDVDARDKETGDLAEWLSESLTHATFQRFIVNELKAKLCQEHANNIIENMFDNDCDFQEFISTISYDIAEKVAIAAIKSKRDEQ